MSLVSGADGIRPGAVGHPQGPTAPGGVGVRHIEHVLGVTVSFDIRDARFHAASLDGAVAWLHWVDRAFDRDEPDSVVAQLVSGRTTPDDLPSEVAEVIDLCGVLESETEGWFSARFAGRFDPHSMVKGWAVERASEMLVQAGSTSHCINGGGDVRVVGEAAQGRPWQIGVADPARPGELLSVVSGADLAVATSGSGSGRSIFDPHTHQPALTRVASTTVVGPDLARADAYATAACAMGDHAYAWLSSLPDYTAVVVADDGALWHTPGWSVG